MRWPWVVIAVWVALAIALPLSVPTLKEMSERHPVAILPADAPATVAAKEMAEAFKQSGSENVVVVVLTNDKGLGPGDETAYRALVDALRQDKRDVAMLQDFITTPPLREVMTSEDRKAWILPVGLDGALGSPRGKEAYTNVADIVEKSTEGAPFTVNVTGPAVTVADLNATGEHDRIRIELAITILLFIILVIIYRNLITMLLPLITIGISVVVAQAVVASLGLLGLGIANQTIIFMSGMMAGAGTDYAVFLISRYHDYLRQGASSDVAVKKALTSIGKVIAASAATVAITFLGMIFAKLGVFSTCGTALAVAVAVAFLAAVTLLPAIMVLAGRRGWIAPRRDLTGRFWRRSGIRIARKPRRYLVSSVMVLIILASCVGLARFNYDDRKTLPASVDSSLGYAALEQHFPINSIIPEYLIVHSPQDLRTPRALADLEQMAQRISQLPGVAKISGITRPTGKPIEQATATYQAGEVGKKLDDGANLITGHSGDLNKLANGADTLADSLGDVRGQVSSAINSVRGLVDALGIHAGPVRREQDAQPDSTTRPNWSTACVSSAMRSSRTSPTSPKASPGQARCYGRSTAVRSASPIPSAPARASSCSDSDTARQDGTFTKIADLARQLQLTQGAQTLGSTLTGLSSALETASRAMRASGLDKPGSLQGRLAMLQQGANTLADASRQVADGVQLLVDQTKQMGSGLREASQFLLAMKQDASTPSMAGFYIPPQFLNLDDFKKAAGIFVSPDGHTVRYLVQTELNPFSTAAMDQVNAITDTARDAQPNTALADAKISMSGFPVDAAGHARLLQPRHPVGHHRHDLCCAADSDRTAACDSCTALSDSVGNNLLPIGARNRGPRISIPFRAGVALECARISLHHFGCGGRRLQYAADLANS